MGDFDASNCGWSRYGEYLKQQETEIGTCAPKRTRVFLVQVVTSVVVSESRSSRVPQSASGDLNAAAVNLAYKAGSSAATPLSSVPEIVVWRVRGRFRRHVKTGCMIHRYNW